jgi:hypothetical protein
VSEVPLPLRHMIERANHSVAQPHCAAVFQHTMERSKQHRIVRMSKRCDLSMAQAERRWLARVRVDGADRTV